MPAIVEADRAATASPDPGVLRELRRIPGVGKSIAVDLWSLGLRAVEDLRGRDPQELYARLEALAGCHVDRCMLYVLRCAVYFAEAPAPDPQRLKWWAWKD
ncbi:MAG: pathogenicity locus [Desulfovibrionaceae bacterium CG1_02_65_16]|nr:MAG: pathogenicity locus [Desulfovibrionaceae bacterium CG1_02_65_16]